MQKYLVAGLAGLLIFGLAFAQSGILIVTVDTFAAKIGQQAEPQIVDVRTSEEYALNHINGAVDVDLNGIDEVKGWENFARERPVFIYAIQHNRPDALANS